MIKDWPSVIAGAFAFVISMTAIVLSMLSVVDHYDAKLVVAACWGLAALVVAVRSTNLSNGN